LQFCTEVLNKDAVTSSVSLNCLVKYECLEFALTRVTAMADRVCTVQTEENVAMLDEFVLG